ncbi:F0F1 ATP synthase subunit B [Pyxidicoccus fallax]|uniref:ATP synthase subunit b n=1 Tax=Pyxidicoccus fallax TaxID=394095 RepID=A0A848LVI4_9BACT|nr:F0F1 ATP synthase subunit B [Pyxidicoccus fallax]NMO21641.1 F0F1 ATP synthase subunit B [Pyxidicoccus fallax]NPC83013.1 F0F1 ATP synthase subunit B [Pyxidicoccus fallax]
MFLPTVLAASNFVQVRPGLIFWTIVTFVLVMVVLRLKAWGPILQLVQERETQIANSVESAKKMLVDAEAKLAEAKEAANKARQEASETIRRNQAEMSAFREEMMAKSRKDADEYKAAARREIEEQKAKAIAEVRSMAVDLSIEVASKLISERMDDSKHRALADQFVQGLPVGGAAGAVRRSA